MRGTCNRRTRRRALSAGKVELELVPVLKEVGAPSPGFILFREVSKDLFTSSISPSFRGTRSIPLELAGTVVVTVRLSGRRSTIALRDGATPSEGGTSPPTRSTSRICFRRNPQDLQSNSSGKEQRGHFSGNM